MGVDIAKSGSEPWLKGIEGDAARELIESDDPVIRVIAGPGSGKTTCLERRIQRLVKKNGVCPETIFAGTFTRAITKELRNALGTKVYVSTLHSLAYDLLRKYPTACQGMQLRFLLKYEEDIMLYDLDQVAVTRDGIHKRRKALRSLHASKAKRKEYENPAFAGAVRQWLQRHRGMLIGEVTYLCVIGLESEDIPLGMFDHVVIDEYQDLTAVEQELVSMIWSKKGVLTVMGDNNQSIYGFRFNHPKGINDFHTAWPECKDLSFVDNWRCGKRILDTANQMLAEADSESTSMNAKRDHKGEMQVIQWKTHDDEIQGLAEYIKRSEESFLVLVPRRFIGYRLKDAIGPDARTVFTEQILEHPIAQKSFTALSLLASPDDFVSARAWLGLSQNRGKPATERNADAYARLAKDVGGHDLLRRIAAGEISVTGTGRRNIKEQAESAVKLIERQMTPEEAVDSLFDESLATEEDDDEKHRWLVDNLRELRTTARRILAQQESPSLAEVVDQMRYMIASRSPTLGNDQEEPRVRIMTLHSAKGLEADNVIIAGVVDQFMPGCKKDCTEIAEQGRLLYVSVTRARDSLIISWSRQIRASDIWKNSGRKDKIITEKGEKWAITSRCRLLPQGLNGVISGKKFLADVQS